MTEIMEDTRTYVLPNRKAFADSITRKFLKYREAPTDDEKDEDLCIRQTESKGTLFSYQKLVRDYLLIETPYRGLLLFHGLGSGKTLSSIAIAEALVENKQIIVMLPAALQDNYRDEIKSKGGPIFRTDNFWEKREITPQTREIAKKMKLSDDYLDRHAYFYITIPGQQSNFDKLSMQDKNQIEEQIKDLIKNRFHFVNYNGITSEIKRRLTEGDSNVFDNSVIIIDESHNFIQKVLNESNVIGPIYDKIYNSVNSKIVCMSGTPIINRPEEISYLMNLLRGPIERITIPIATSPSWDEQHLTKFFQKIPEVDTIEFNSVKRHILLTRNPPHFESVYGQDKENKIQRTGVKYNKDVRFTHDIIAWAETIKPKFEAEFPGNVFADKEKFVVEKLTCLPTHPTDFATMFLDGFSIKNAIMFQRRIQGLVSYYKGADPRMLPIRLDEAQTLKRIPMSTEQFLRYLDIRMGEIELDARKGRLRTSATDNFNSFRMKSRLACNYTIPDDLKLSQPVDQDVEETEDNLKSKDDILKAIKANPDKYLTDEALQKSSPKMLQMAKDLIANYKNTQGEIRNQFVYSQYLTLEGLGVFAAILEYRGFQEYKFARDAANRWIESPEMDPDKPAYGFYAGNITVEERNMLLKIFNNRLESLPAELRDSVKKRKLCVMMASSAGAEGITLENVRNVYITEAYWNPARIQQVIGRAIRICSHARLPIPERSVKVNIYLSVLSEEQAKTMDAPNIVAVRRNDTSLKRYEGEPNVNTFMTSDEYLYEISYEKSLLIERITKLLKQAAIDCEIHRKLHQRMEPLIQCMRFDSDVGPESLAYNPFSGIDERDEMIRLNRQVRKRELQKVQINEQYYIIDTRTMEVYDISIFETSQRLLKIGQIKKEERKLQILLV